MKEFLNKIKVNDHKLTSLIYEVTSDNLSKLSEVCFYPKLKNTYIQLLHEFNVTENDIDELGEKFWDGMPEAKWLLQNDSAVVFYIFVMYYLTINNMHKQLESFMIFYQIRNYTNLAYRYIKYCNPDVFLATLENISPQHLFNSKKNIPSAIQYLAQETLKRYSSIFHDPDIHRKEISKFIQESRHRLNQSMRSFSVKYYELSKNGTKIKHPYEDSTESQHDQTKQVNIIVEDITNRICVYREIDNTILQIAIQSSNNSKILSVELVKEMSNNKYSEYIHNSLESFLQVISNISDLCSEGKFLKFIDNLMATKRKDDYSSFKKNITILSYELMKGLKLDSAFNNYSSVKQRIIYKFIATYLVLFIKTKICGRQIQSKQYL